MSRMSQKEIKSLIAKARENDIKAQIGRVLNGLEPADCTICRRCIKATPINPAHCDWNGKDCNPGVNFECEGFQVRP